MYNIPDQVICLRYGDQPVWRAFVGGKLIAAEWSQPGPAQAAIKVERARQVKKGFTSSSEQVIKKR